jgi:hypothetical protein
MRYYEVVNVTPYLTTDRPQKKDLKRFEIDVYHVIIFKVMALR